MSVETVVPTALFLSIAYVIVGVTKVLADARTRRLLVQSNATAEFARAVTAPLREDLHAALRWAFVLGAVGIALAVMQFLPYRSTDPIVYGTVLLFAAGGLLAYYAVGRRVGAAAGAV